jgi:hypothetical protein
LHAKDRRNFGKIERKGEAENTFDERYHGIDVTWFPGHSPVDF